MDKKQKASLAAKAHSLKPIVMMGQKGLTPAVLAETDLALTAHELIKIKISADDKAERNAIAEHICNELQAEFIQLIGNIAIIYRKSED